MILCMDMDAFFASVEQASNPKLRGKPIAVIGSKERTVVVTSSYEAREYGVKTGMTKYEALKACPWLEVVVGRTRKYTYVSKEIYNFLKTITPDVEAYSIDEAFLDLTGTGYSPEDAAYMIKSFVKRSFDITCSVGSGPNKFVAKMATGVNKPDGFYHVPEDDVLDFVDGFRLKDFWGIGRRLSKRFANMGIFTPGDLRELGEERLVEMFGINGTRLFRLAHGEYPKGIDDDDPPAKSIGHSMTLPRDIRSREAASDYILQLSEMVSSRARKNKYSGRTISVAVRYTDMSTHRQMHMIPFFTSATHHIFETAMEVFDEIWNGEPIRLLGVSLSKLVTNCVTLQNVSDEGRNWADIYDAMDSINEKFGSQTLSFGSMLNCTRRGAGVISPAWRPEGMRDVSYNESY
ncbi:DNA polymerase IV [Limisalsivibrio acetivorans]|uniref:DNA polymerase IV n=1 Tax=Limisalsivibrio acetivorans TaxID=1304888 RepID=UPI0003B4815F|nr:DNA polymerase IV [Limisalsivibrio acetivorans]